MARLARAVGESAALELLVTGRRVDAAEAASLGFVTHVVADADLTAECSRLAAQIAARSPAAVRAVKQTLRSCVGLTLEEADELETRAFLECFDTDEARVAISSFVRRREVPG
jgi:enoyl-CoA hydratase/carnithine racemase